MHEFWHLLTDPAHWGLEIVANLVIDGLLLALLWPRLRSSVFRHLHRYIQDAKEGRPLDKEGG